MYKKYLYPIVLFPVPLAIVYYMHRAISCFFALCVYCVKRHGYRVCTSVLSLTLQAHMRTLTISI